MGAAGAAPWVAGGLSAVGSIVSADDQKDAAKSLANAPVKIPGDIARLRQVMASVLGTGVGGGLPNVPITGPRGQLEDQLGLFSSPEFVQLIGQLFDPQTIIGQQREAGLPALQDQLQLQRGSDRAALAIGGNRFSTDAARIFSESARRGVNQFEADLAKGLPQLTAVQAGALGSIPPALTGASANALQALTAIPSLEFAQQRFPFEVALPFSTAGVGGTASASLAPFLGASGVGGAFNNAANIASLFPLLSAGLNPPTGAEGENPNQPA
jgi:hypothetical protein